MLEEEEEDDDEDDDDDDDDDEDDEDEDDESVGADEEALSVAEAAEALEMMELASGGVMVVVLELELPLLEAARASSPSSCFWVSMKAMVGPARTAWFARSRTLLFRGCPVGSSVMKMPTGPSIPSGTMHCERGSAIAVGRPPTSI